MQGCVFKTIIAITAAISSSLLFAASTDNSSFTLNDTNKAAMSRSSAGCMGCHQGETVTLSENSLADQSIGSRKNTAQKKKSALNINKR